MAGKEKRKYVCSSCGAETLTWMGRCPQCGEWDTLSEYIEPSHPVHHGTAGVLQTPVPLSDISSSKQKRLKIGIEDMDRPLGGGIVPGSVILWGGEPGIGKSTLIMQVCKKISEQHKRILYYSGEESELQLKLRADRLRVDGNSFYICSGGNIESILRDAAAIKPEILVIDSIQTMYMPDISSAMGSPAQIRESAAMLIQFAKEKNVAVLVIGHVTKEGNIAGPRTLEHMVDVVLYLEGERRYQFRVLRTVKNRFGSTSEAGLFIMEEEGLKSIDNPSKYFLQNRAKSTPGSMVTTCMEGLRPMMVEIQALAVHSVLSIPRRISSGYDYNRMIILLAVLEKRCHFPFSSDDVYVNVVGGVKVRETAADLPLLLALFSIKKDLILPSDAMTVGEVGLTGEILPVSHVTLRIGEACKMGFNTFYLPLRNKKEVDAFITKNHLPAQAYYFENVNEILSFLQADR